MIRILVTDTILQLISYYITKHNIDKSTMDDDHLNLVDKLNLRQQQAQL